MLSIPPAITTLLSPKPIPIAAYTAAFNPELHTLLIVVHGIALEIPAPKDACLAGFYLDIK